MLPLDGTLKNDKPLQIHINLCVCERFELSNYIKA